MNHRFRSLLAVLALVLLVMGCSFTSTTTTTTTAVSTTTSNLPTSQTTTTTTLTSTTQTSVATTTSNASVLVSFDLQGGSFSIASAWVRQGGQLPTPQTPIRLDHRFVGWYLDPEGTVAWSFADQIVTEPLTLYAVWEAVTIDDEVAEPGVTTVETFDGLTQSGSSYTVFSYQGVSSVLWQMTGARADVALDGKAVTLGGSIDQSKIQFTLNDGLASLSFQAVKTFTNTNARILDIRINGVSYGEFVVDPESTTPQTFRLDAIDLTGTVLVEIVHGSGAEARAQVVVDNVSFTTYSGSTVSIEERRLALDVETLAIPTSFETDGSLSFPTFGTYGSQIVWQYADGSSSDNTLVDLIQGSVIVPETGLKTVSVRAVLTYGLHTSQVVFEFKLGIADPVTLQEAAGQQNGSSVRTKGIVSSMYEEGGQIVMHLDDGVSGLRVVVAPTTAFGVAIGDEILIRGVRHASNGMPYVTAIVALEILSSKEAPESIPVVDPFELASSVSRTVRLSGLLANAVSPTATTAKIVTTEGWFDVRWPNTGTFSDMGPLFASSPAGAPVVLEATVYQNNTEFYLLVTRIEAVRLDAYVDSTLAAEILEEWFQADLPAQTNQKLTLPNASNLPFSALLDWSSSDPLVIDSAGNVVPQTSDVVVTLTATIRIGATVLVTRTFQINVVAASGYTGYYATLSGLSGAALKDELARIISTGVKSISYSATSYVLDETDADPNRPGNILLVYNRASVSGVWDGATTWNKEHVWPQSKLGTASDSDLHNLKPSNPGINSSRGNLPFVAGTGTYGPRSGGWFPGEDDKGDIARIVFYMNTRWGLAINSGIGTLSVFLEWHNADPVDDFERSRNEVIYANQNNRNPYIDHPELVPLVYGASPQSADAASFPIWILRLRSSQNDWTNKTAWASVSTPIV